MDDLKPNLPFWFDFTEARKLADAARGLWQQWEDWINEGLAQASIADCSEAALAVHAYDRAIERLPGEPVAVWRGRVQHAFTAVKWAGLRVGLETILDAHGVTNYSIEERVPGLDFDIVIVNLDPDSLSVESHLLQSIFQRWGGRPTRRFTAGHTLTNTVYHGPGAAEFLSHTLIAS